MKANRLNKMLHMLIEYTFLTAQDFSKTFNISTRTVYRDIQTLIDAGFPISTDKGVTGGIRIAKGYKLDEKLLNGEEKKLLLTNLYNKINMKKDPNNEMVTKLNSLLNNTVDNWIEIEFENGINDIKEKQLFNTIKNAILNKNVISFYYYGMYSSDNIREVEPIRLVFRNSAWYLYGYYRLRNNFRFFKVRSILDLNVLDEKFTRQINGSVLLSLHNQEANYELLHIKLKVSSNYGYRAFDDFSGCKVLKDGSVEVETDVIDGEELIEKLLSYGSDLKVLEPESLKTELKDKIESMLKIYVKKSK